MYDKVHGIATFAALDGEYNIDENGRNKRKELEEKNGFPFLFRFDAFGTLNRKTRSMTLKDIFMKSLLRIKGIGLEKALAIVEHYPTPISLIEGYRSKQLEKERIEMLACIKYGDNNRNRKVGAKASEAIYEIFFADPGIKC